MSSGISHFEGPSVREMRERGPGKGGEIKAL